ncbi:MAG: response regulator [Spirochaetales bacterium]|nr:response regulator [Spirochaetales bacterium]
MIGIQKRKEKIIKNSFILLFFFLFFLLSVTCSLSFSGKDFPQIQDGYLDLSVWSNYSRSKFNLNGRWECYWGDFLEYQDFYNNTIPQKTYLPVPGLWKGNAIQGKDLTDEGFCTYRLHIDLPRKSNQLGLRVKAIFSSYRLFVNDKLIIESGIPGKTEETTSRKTVPKTIFFDVQEPVDLIIHVSNFGMEQGGIIDPIMFGTQASILQDRELNLGYELFLIGGAFIIGLYHLIFSLGKKREKSSFFFGLATLSASIRIFLHTEHFILVLWPDFPWEILIRLEILSYYSTVTLFILYVYYLFPDEIWKYFPGIFLIIHICAALTLFLSYEIFNTILTFMYIPVSFASLYIFYIIARAIIHKQQGAIVFFTGFIILFITVINDILYAQEIILTRHIFSSGLFIFIFCQAILLNNRFSDTFSKIKKLSENLNTLLEKRKKYSEELEEEVALRTSDLSETNRALIRTMEDVNRANQAKSIFLANMSHELRTPLNAILGFAEIIEKQGDQENFHKYSRMIVKESEKLLTLINQILDISKIEAGKLEIEYIPFHLTDLLSSISSFYGLMAEEAGLTFDMIIQGTIPDYIRGDPLRLRQILVNLIGNAVKFTHQGSITVIIENYEKKSDQSVILKFQIIDTGIGIPEEKREVIFQKFEQGESYVTKKYGGSGLGITLAKQFTELMGGEIGVKSEVGKGSVFWFTIPFELSSEKEQNELKRGSVQLLPSQIYATILVVEDYPANQQVVTVHLSHTGCLVLIADNGKKAIELLQEKSCDLILMDIQMPVMDGYETTSHIRNDLKMEDIPIIGLTAHAFEYERKHCIDAGMNDVLVKPFQKKQLIEKVTYWLLHYSKFDKNNIIYKEEQVEKKEETKTVTDNILLPVNMNQIKVEFAGDIAFFFKILLTFLTNLNEQLPLLQIAIDNKEKDKITFEAHRIRGAASNLRAEKLSLIATDIEEIGKAEVWADLPVKIKELKSEVLRLWQFYKDWEKETT